jgi:hypothetical protein
MSGTCKDCRFWSEYTIDPSRRLRGCERWKDGYRFKFEDIQNNEVNVENDEGWGALMGPDFGCVLFEAKQRTGTE